MSWSYTTASFGASSAVLRISRQPIYPATMRLPYIHPTILLYSLALSLPLEDEPTSKHLDKTPKVS